MAKKINVTPYDTVIFASYFYVGKISKLQWFREIDTKNKIVCVTGASPVTSPDVAVTIKNNFPIDYNDYCIFYMQSVLSYTKMGLADRLLMKAKCIFAKKKFRENSEEYQGVSNFFDATYKETLKPLYDYLRTIENI